MKSATKPKNHAIHANTIESLRESAYEVTSEAIKNQASATVDTLWNQLLGVKEQPQQTSGDMMAGQSINLTNVTHAENRFRNNNTSSYAEDKGKLVHAEKRFHNVRGGIDYAGEILHGEKRISKETEQMLSRQIQEIANELRQLVNSSQELAVQFKDVAVEQRITKPGKYHVSLFQFVLTIVRQARMKVENSSACLAMSKGKKGKKDYWSMAKTQGTTFTMNNERAIATQAG